MRAIQLQHTGGLEVLEVSDVPSDPPGLGDVQVRIAAAGVNFIDLHHRAGRYPVEFPMILGIEAAGVVEQVGDESDGWFVGQRVAFILPQRSVKGRAQLGGYTELANVPVANLVVVPDDVELRDAAAVLNQGITAHYLTTSAAPIGPGDVALVHSAAGGVGLLLTQLCKRTGSSVIAVASTEEKRERALAAGADDTLAPDDPAFVERVRELTGGMGVDVVYDGVGRATFDQSLRSLRTRGVMALFGQASGQVESFNPHLLNPLGSLTLVSPALADYVSDADEYAWRASAIFEAVSNGDLRVMVDKVYPLEDAVEAHRRLEERETIGKILLVP